MRKSRCRRSRFGKFLARSETSPCWPRRTTENAKSSTTWSFLVRSPRNALCRMKCPRGSNDSNWKKSATLDDLSVPGLPVEISHAAAGRDRPLLNDLALRRENETAAATLGHDCPRSVGHFAV